MPETDPKRPVQHVLYHLNQTGFFFGATQCDGYFPTISTARSMQQELDNTGSNVHKESKPNAVYTASLCAAEDLLANFKFPPKYSFLTCTICFFSLLGLGHICMAEQAAPASMWVTWKTFAEERTAETCSQKARSRTNKVLLSRNRRTTGRAPPPS